MLIKKGYDSDDDDNDFNNSKLPIYVTLEENVIIHGDLEHKLQQPDAP